MPHRIRFSAAVRGLLMPVAAGAIYFGAAGRVDLPAAWTLLAVLAGFNLSLVMLLDPSLLRERVERGPGERDRATVPVAMALLLAHWVVSGLDVGRWDFSPLPMSVRWAGVCVYGAALSMLLWTMRINKFYSSAVRVQHDRGHEPVTVGPYRFVRHPGYAASIAAAFGGGAALGSMLGMAPVVLFAALFIRRTFVEDRMLIAELPGYAEYAERVRYRFVPGLV